MKKSRFIVYPIIILAVLCLIYLFLGYTMGSVTINVKDAKTHEYVNIVSFKIEPDLQATAMPGTDGRGPYHYDGHLPSKHKIHISADNYKTQDLNLFLFPFRTYTIYLEPTGNP